METWEQDADVPSVFTSTVVDPGLLLPPLPTSLERRKYVVVAPGGRLMVVVKESEEITRWWKSTLPCFKVHVLDAGGERWKETDDIGDATLFDGANGLLCVSTRERPELRASCVYYTQDDGKRGLSIRVCSLKDGTVEEVEALGLYRSTTQPPAWFTPSIPLSRRVSKKA